MERVSQGEPISFSGHPERIVAHGGSYVSARIAGGELYHL
jgi:hypothetical protein